MRNNIFLTVLLTVFSFGFLNAQNLNKAKLDSLFTALIANNKAMGSISISKNGNLIYSRSIGYSCISEKEKSLSTDLTKYRIGSISKMFTATMIFQLIEEGKLSLTTTLDKYFPELPNANKITISHLLSHKSGLYNFTNDPLYTSWMTQTKTHKEMLAIIGKYKVDFEPGEKLAYSNSNYVLLGYIIEEICKKSYSKILQKRILSKVGLTNTYVGDKTDTIKNECYSYKFLTSWEMDTETDLSIPGGAGSLVSTPSDLTKFIEALFSFKLISKNSLNQMETFTDGCGMGMFKYPFFEKSVYGHNGRIDGFTSSLGFIPEDSLAIAYCANGTVYPMNNIMIGVLSICYNKPYTIPILKGISLTTEELDKYLGVYSSAQVPLKITITKDNTTLKAQATGQQSFALEAQGKDIFTQDRYGVRIEFNPEKNELTLKQGGAVFLFTRDK